MILVIPFLKLENGRNLLVIKGKEGTEDYYRDLSDDPIKFCKLIRSENFKTIHIDIVDSIDNNFDVLKDITKSLDIPIQAKAVFKSLSQCKQLLDNGIYRVIVNDLDLAQRDEFQDMIKEYTPSRVVCFVNQENVDAKRYISLIEYLKEIKRIGFRRIVFSPQGLEYHSINTDALKKINLRITLFDSVESAEELWRLNELMAYGVDSVIIGEPFYQNGFPCQAMWREIEGELKTTF